jgi:hypothetical protein
MFKILKSLSKSLGGGKTAEAKAQAASKAGGTLLDKVNKGLPAVQAGPPKSAEERCGIPAATTAAPPALTPKPASKPTKCSMPSSRSAKSTSERFDPDSAGEMT